MNLVFITLINLSDINERGIYHDLLKKFRDEGHNVYVIYPVERRKKQFTGITKQRGITFLRVKSLNIQKTNNFEKGIGTIFLEKQYLKAFVKYFKDIKFDLILFSTPPVTLTNIVRFIKKKNNAVSYLLLKDIFPQNAVDLGMMKKNGMLHKFFTKKEKKLYHLSDYIGCMSPANVEYIIKHNQYLDPNTIEVNPNSIAPISNELNIEEVKKIKAKYHIPLNSIVFIYGGNLGKPQGISFLIEVLQSQYNNKFTFFIIVGSGTEYPVIKNWFENRKPENALLLNTLQKSEYDKLLQAADIGLLFLDKRFTIPNFPSRLLSYLENKMPVIAATDRNTDLGEILQNSECGYWCESGNLFQFNLFVGKFITNRNLIQEMGENGYDLLIREYTVDNSYRKIASKFSKNNS